MIVRRASPEDRSRIIELCRASLGWKAGDPNERFFAWKHDDNSFGPSPAWVAEAEGRLLGLRAFLRWRFRDDDGAVLHAVRAVDTATHPDAQGRGIFTKLTLGALPDLREMGIDFVFNTPNDKSRPGYLKMGWGDVGKVPVGVRVARPSSFRAVLGARVPAEKWSQPSTVGLSAAEAFVDDVEVEALLAGVGRPRGITTDRDAAYLRWRFSFEPLHYRVVPVGDSIRDGVVVVRFRRRGAALEATVAELLTESPSSARSAVTAILQQSGADYAIAAGGRELVGGGFVPAPLGPILTWKAVTRVGVPVPSELSLAMGDVELF